MKTYLPDRVVIESNINLYTIKYSANTCKMLDIPMRWAGVPINDIRYVTIQLNRK